MSDNPAPEDAAERMEAFIIYTSLFEAQRMARMDAPLDECFYIDATGEVQVKPGRDVTASIDTIASLTAELAAMRDEVMLYREAAVYNVMMGGAVFTGRWNMSALNRARKVSEAARAQASFSDAEGRNPMSDNLAPEEAAP